MARTSNSGKTNVAAWTALLLLVLGSVLVGLFVAGRLLLSLERDQGVQAFDAARRRHAETTSRAEAPKPYVLARAAPSAAASEPAASPHPHAAARALQAAPPDQSLWSRVRVVAYRESQAENAAPEGVLRIPAVGVEVPVYEGTSDLNLNRGAGRVEWTPPLGPAGNVGIAAHRDGFFRPLKDIAMGDQIIVDLLDSTLRYEVVDIRIVGPDDVEVLTATEHASVTLITCYPFYFVGSAPQRFIVRAELADVIRSFD